MNKEFTRCKKAGGRRCRFPVLRFIMMIISGLALLAACSHTTAYAAENPTNSIVQTGEKSYYEGDGVFSLWGDNKQKHYTTLHVFPDSLDRQSIQYVTYYCVTNYGRRCKYRFIGYDNGVEVFRSGLADYGESIYIGGTNFNQYDVYLSDYDDNGDMIKVETLTTAAHKWTFTYYVPLPTQPEGEEETVPTTEYIDLSDIENEADLYYMEYDPDMFDYFGGVLSFFNNISLIMSSIMDMNDYIWFLWMPIFILTLVRWIMWGD